VARVFIPAPLRALSRGLAELEIEAATVGEVIAALETRFPGMADALVEGGVLRPGMAVSVDSEVATLGLHEPVQPGAEVHFLPALGGGSANPVAAP
jgi:molybdopterin converting factor small subunit